MSRRLLSACVIALLLGSNPALAGAITVANPPKVVMKGKETPDPVLMPYFTPTFHNMGSYFLLWPPTQSTRPA